MLWVAPQAIDEFTDLFALKADVIDCNEQWEPRDENKNLLYSKDLNVTASHVFTFNLFHAVGFAPDFLSHLV